MFGLQGHLIVAVILVEHAPDFAITLFLEYVLNSREGMRIVLRVVVYLSNVLDQSVVVRFFLGTEKEGLFHGLTPGSILSSSIIWSTSLPFLSPWI
jgi:hypothetical protein